MDPTINNENRSGKPIDASLTENSNKSRIGDPTENKDNRSSKPKEANLNEKSENIVSQNRLDTPTSMSSTANSSRSGEPTVKPSNTKLSKRRIGDPTQNTNSRKSAPTKRTGNPKKRKLNEDETASKCKRQKNEERDSFVLSWLDEFKWLKYEVGCTGSCRGTGAKLGHG